MDISVIIPTCNRARTLARALRSVFAQTLPAAEVLVVDDGSVDQTPWMLRSWFPSVRRIRQPNRGVSRARNVGIEAARGTWLALLDSDDTWHPRKLQRQAEALAADPHALICHTDEIWIRRGRRVNPMKKHAKRGGWIFPHCLARCVISPSSVLIHRRLFTEAGLFDEQLPACEDYDLWLRVCARHPVLYCPQPLITKYGGHGDQLSGRYWGMDRFRIRALERLIAGGTLDAGQLDATHRVLLEKMRIVVQGARRRGNQALVHAYGDRLGYYEARLERRA